MTATLEERELWSRWFAAGDNPEVDVRLHALFAELDQQIRARGPVCWTSGRCCNFEAYGHRLYVTGLEIAWMLLQVRQTPDGEERSLPVVDLRGPCPFQVDRLCSVHTVRPLGCRVFFCQRGTQDWQHELYEQFLTRLRQLHDELDLPYRYMEWRAGLAEARASVCPLSPISLATARGEKGCITATPPPRAGAR